MKLETRAFIRGVVLLLLLDGAVAYVIQRLFYKQEPTAFWVVLAVIWGISIAVSLRRSLHRAVTLWAGMRDMEEYFRRKLIEFHIPAPSAYDVEPDRYLCNVADNRALAEDTRFGAVFLAAEISKSAPNAGFMYGIAARMAACSALNKLPR
jgi:hypothetical protein